MAAEPLHRFAQFVEKARAPSSNLERVSIPATTATSYIDEELETPDNQC